jgi:hypothetical protein
MNKREVRDTLNAHKEHFRVLPTLACNALTELLRTLEVELHAEDLAEAEKPKRVVGKRAKKSTKKSKRPKR